MLDIKRKQFCLQLPKSIHRYEKYNKLIIRLKRWSHIYFLSKGVLCETYLGGVGVTTTAAPVTSCPIGLSNVCQNGGTCLILNNNNVFCSCRIGYTGKLLSLNFPYKMSASE